MMISPTVEATARNLAGMCGCWCQCHNQLGTTWAIVRTARGEPRTVCEECATEMAEHTAITEEEERK